MANLTNVKFWVKRFAVSPVVTYQPVTFAVYEGTDPNSLGTAKFSSTFSYGGLPTGSWQQISFDMDINVSQAIFVIDPPHSYSQYPGVGNGVGQICDVRQNASGATGGQTYYHINILPCSKWTGSYNIAGGDPFQTVYYQYTVDTVTYTTAGSASNDDTFAINVMTSTVPGEKIKCTGDPGDTGGFYWTQGSAMTMSLGGPPPEKAITPSFPDGFTGAPNGIPATLTWVDGSLGDPEAATSYDVYMGTSFGGPDTLVAEDVPAGSEYFEIPQDIQQQLGNMPSRYLEALTTYEWYIVSKNADGETVGDTWEFSTNSIQYRNLGAPHTPTPITTATGQSVTITGFSWLGCEGATKNTVYMGQTSGNLTKKFVLDAGDINTVNPSPYRFEYGQTTYWRVETTNGLATLSGAEWSLTFLTLGNGDGTGIVVTPAGPWGAGGSPTKRLGTMLTNKGIWYEDLL